MTSASRSTKHKTLATIKHEAAEAKAWLAPFCALIDRWQYCFVRAQFLAQHQTFSLPKDHHSQDSDELCPFALLELEGLLADLNQQAAALPSIPSQSPTSSAHSIVTHLAGMAQLDLTLSAFRIKASCLLLPSSPAFVQAQDRAQDRAQVQAHSQASVSAKPQKLFTIVTHPEKARTHEAPKDGPQSGRDWAIAHFCQQQGVIEQCKDAIHRAEQYALTFAENLKATQASLYSNDLSNRTPSNRTLSQRTAQRIAGDKATSQRLHSSLDRADDRIFWWH